MDILMDGRHLYGEFWDAVTAPITLGYTYRFAPPEGTHTYTARYYVRARGVEKEGFSDPITINTSTILF